MYTNHIIHLKVDLHHNLYVNNMGNKGGIPKSRRRKALKAHPCGCHWCTGTTHEEWLKLKYNIKPKHKIWIIR